MPLIEYLVTLFIMWWVLSWFFRRITSPMRPVVRWGKKWSSRSWHGFWGRLWDLLYRKPAQQRGIGYGLWWLGCIICGVFALSVLQKGEGYDKIFMFGMALALFKFLLNHYSSLFRSQRTLPRRRPRRFRR
jgi:hypothetical protein